MIRVLETIIYLPIIEFKKFKNYFYSRSVVPKSTREVKILCSFLLISVSYANTNPSNYTLSKGQVAEIRVGKIKSFIIGNKSILKARYDKVQGKMIVKALMQGFSEIKIHGHRDRTLKIYVLSKTKQLKLLDITNNLDAIGFKKNQIIGKSIIVRGEIDSLTKYKLFHSLYKENSNSIQPEINLNNEVKKDIIGKVYYEFFQNFYEDISCEKRNFRVLCFTTDEILKDKKFISNLKSQINVDFRTANKFHQKDNYSIELKIFQIEQLDGREVQIGLDNLGINFQTFLNSGLKSLNESVLVSLSQENTHISTLASPKALIQLNNPLELKVGTEIPYQSQNIEGHSNTTWKFAGLKIDLTVSREINKFKVQYRTILSRPHHFANQVNISGNFQSSSFLIDLDSPLKAFQIDLKTNDDLRKSVPILGDIPILKYLFQSKSNIETYKRIIAIVRLVRR